MYVLTAYSPTMPVSEDNPGLRDWFYAEVEAELRGWAARHTPLCVATGTRSSVIVAAVAAERSRVWGSGAGANSTHTN